MDADLSLWPGFTNTPLETTTVTDFFNAQYRRIQKPVMLIIENYPTLYVIFM